MAERGAFKFFFELTDSDDNSLARAGGIRTRETFTIVPGVLYPQDYEISAGLLTVKDDNLVMRFDVAQRTKIVHDISLNETPQGSATWRSENVRIVETITAGKHQEFELDAIKDGKGIPIRLTVNIDRFQLPN
jgi:hypothetical protein